MADTNKIKLIVWTWGRPFSYSFPKNGFIPLLERKKEPGINSGVLDLIEWLSHRTKDGIVYEDTRINPAEPPDLMCEIHMVSSRFNATFLGLGYDARALSSEVSATCYLMGLWCSTDPIGVKDFLVAAKAELLTTPI